MQLQRNAVVVLVSGLCLCAVFLFLLRGPAPSVGEPAPAGKGLPVLAETAPAETSRAAATQPLRLAVPAADRDAATQPARADQETLVVHAVWSDGQPAPDIALALRVDQPGHPDHPIRSEISNQDGTARFTGLASGSYSLSSDRGGTVPAEVLAGAQNEVRFGLPAGVDVGGVVVDQSGAGVAGAGIWLTSGSTGWLGGRVAARSDAKGEFQLRAAARGESVGAIADGFAPSELRDLDELDTAPPPVSLRLELLAPGGGLEGTVHSPAGEPMSGAVVCVGKQPLRFPTRAGAHSYQETWTPLTQTTDTRGRFRFGGVGVGRHPVVARAPGYPIWKGEVEVLRGATARLDVYLVAGVTVSGTVRDDAGKPVPGTVIRAFDSPLDETFIQGGQFDHESVFGDPFSAADAAGRYRLGDLASGTIHLYAMAGGYPKVDESRVHAKTVLQGESGADLRWDPVLEAGHTIRGSVTYRDGAPMRTFVSARNETTGRSQGVTTDAKGRFRFVSMDAAHYTLGVQYWDAPKGTPPLEKRMVWPDGGEERLVAVFDAPGAARPGRVRGTVEDAGGRLAPAGALVVVLQSDRGWWRTAPRVAGAEFVFEKIPPGRYKALALSGDDVICAGAWFELAAGEDHSVGTLVTEPGGTLLLRVKRDAAAANVYATGSATPADTDHPRTLQIGKSRELRVANLSAGSYKVRVYGEGMATIVSSVEVQQGREAVLELELQRGAERVFEVALPADRELGALRVAVADAAGRSYLDITQINVAMLGNPYRCNVCLPRGRFTIVAEGSKGPKARADFEVRDLDGEQPVVRLELK